MKRRLVTVAIAALVALAILQGIGHLIAVTKPPMIVEGTIYGLTRPGESISILYTPGRSIGCRNDAGLPSRFPHLRDGDRVTATIGYVSVFPWPFCRAYRVLDLKQGT